MNFSTTNVVALTAAFGTLRKMNDLGPFYFAANGMHLCSCFDKYTGAIIWDASAEVLNSIGTYRCTRNEYLMLDCAVIAQLLGSSKNWDTFTLTRQQDTDCVRVVLQDKEKRARQTTVPLLNRGLADDQQITHANRLKTLQYSDRVVLLSRLFKQTVAFAKTRGFKTLTVKYNAAQRQLFIGGTADDGDIYDEKGKVTFYCTGQHFGAETVTAHYPLEVFVEIIRVSKASEHVTLYPATERNLPIKLEYEMSGLGTLAFFCIPRAIEKKSAQ